MKRYIYILIFCLALALPTLAVNYVAVDGSGKIFIDTDSTSNYHAINNRNNLRSIWVKVLNDGSEAAKNYEKLHNKKYWYFMSQEIFDCDKKEVAFKYTVYYDLKKQPINLSTKTVPDYLLEWFPVVPETYGNIYYNYACGVYNN